VRYNALGFKHLQLTCLARPNEQDRVSWSTAKVQNVQPRQSHSLNHLKDASSSWTPKSNFLPIMSKSKEIGTLVVVVLKAQHLHQPSFYKQDPYAQVSLSGLTEKTKVASKGGQHPLFDDEFRFPVYADEGQDRKNRLLEVACYKQETKGDDVLLGKGSMDIEETLKTGEFDGRDTSR